MKHLFTYNPEKDFDGFLVDLKKNDTRAWNWLVAKFRLKLIPYLRKQLLNYPINAILSKDQFIEEVLEETLIQFLKLYKQGIFTNYGNLEAMVVTIAGYKLKEGFATLKKEQRFLFVPSKDLNILIEKEGQKVDKNKLENIKTVKEKLNQLPTIEKEVITRFFAGEALQDIANDLNISPVACRKRKQRIISKLKALVLKSILIILLIFHYG